jgi:hypothetical protein
MELLTTQIHSVLLPFIFHVEIDGEPHGFLKGKSFSGCVVDDNGDLG